MNINLRRSLISSTALAGALLASPHLASAATVNGGGSTLAGPTYSQEYVTDGTEYSGAGFSFNSFCLVGSGNGTSAFVSNITAPLVSEDITDCSSSNYPSGTPIHFGASDAFIDGISYGGVHAEVVFRSLYSQPLIQLPMMGTPVAMAFNLPGKTSNGAITLTDAQVCNILSGSYTDWSQVTGAGVTGAIQVAYRSDGSGTTFLTTSHLVHACNPSSGPIGFTSTQLAAMPTTSFASIFGGSIPANFHGEAGSQGVEAYIAANSYSVGYLSPDWTKVSTTGSSHATYPYVAAMVNSHDSRTYLPNTTNTATALGTVTVPSGSAETTQSNWAPQAPDPSVGYPIVGFTYWFVATCYNNTGADANAASNLIAFLQSHYNTDGNEPDMVADISAGGFVPVPGETANAPVASGSLAAAINAAFLTGSDSEHLNIATIGTGSANATVCNATGVVGR